MGAPISLCELSAIFSISCSEKRVEAYLQILSRLATVKNAVKSYLVLLMIFFVNLISMVSFANENCWWKFLPKFCVMAKRAIES